MLLSLLKAEPRNERAWLCLAAALDDPSRKQECVKRALEINPASAEGRRMQMELDKAAIFAVTVAAQPEFGSLRSALMPEDSSGSTKVQTPESNVQPGTPAARLGDALGDGLLAGMGSAVLALAVPVLGLLSGSGESFYFVLGLVASLALPLLGGLGAGYLYNRRRPNVNKNHFALAGGLAGLLSGVFSGLVSGMLVALSGSQAIISLEGVAGISQYMLLCGLAPAALGFGVGAVGAMLFGSFVPVSDSVHANEDPNSAWNRFKRVAERRARYRAIGIVVAIVLIFLCKLLQQ